MTADNRAMFYYTQSVINITTYNHNSTVK